jgi:hypothetical protein
MGDVKTARSYRSALVTQGCFSYIALDGVGNRYIQDWDDRTKESNNVVDDNLDGATNFDKDGAIGADQEFYVTFDLGTTEHVKFTISLGNGWS